MQRSGLLHRCAGGCSHQEAAAARGARRPLTKPPAGERRPGRLNGAAAQLPSPRDTNALTEPRYSGKTRRPARTAAARHTCAYRARSRRRRARAPRGAAQQGGPGGSARPGTKGPRPPPLLPPPARPAARPLPDGATDLVPQRAGLAALQPRHQGRQGPGGRGGAGEPPRRLPLRLLLLGHGGAAAARGRGAGWPH